MSSWVYYLWHFLESKPFFTSNKYYIGFTSFLRKDWRTRGSQSVWVKEATRKVAFFAKVLVFLASDRYHPRKYGEYRKFPNLAELWLNGLDLHCLELCFSDLNGPCRYTILNCVQKVLISMDFCKSSFLFSLDDERSNNGHSGNPLIVRNFDWMALQ